jgi:hypothetical protein
LTISHLSIIEVIQDNLSASENGLPLLLERLKSLVPILRVDNSLVHFILHILPRPRNSLKASPHTNGSSLADLLRQSNSLTKGRSSRLTKNLGAIASLFRDYLDKAIRNAEKVGLRSADATAGQDKIARTGEADEGREPVGAAGAGDDA